MHAAFHERAPLQKMDGRVFLLSLRLALSLKLSLPAFFLCVAASADVANELASKPTAIMVNVDFMVGPP
jgi:hypothetical protein